MLGTHIADRALAGGTDRVGSGTLTGSTGGGNDSALAETSAATRESGARWMVAATSTREPGHATARAAVTSSTAVTRSERRELEMAEFVCIRRGCCNVEPAWAFVLFRAPRNLLAELLHFGDRELDELGNVLERHALCQEPTCQCGFFLLAALL